MMEKLKRVDLDTKTIGNGIFEVQAQSDKNIVRSLLCYFEKNRILILYIFVKKITKNSENSIRGR